MVLFLHLGVFNLLTRAFNVPTCAFSLPFNLETRGFELVIRGFKLVTRGFELVTPGFELVSCGFELVTCKFELVTRVLLFHQNRAYIFQNKVWYLLLNCFVFKKESKSFVIYLFLTIIISISIIYFFINLFIQICNYCNYSNL